jgi:hypothetical protein
MRTVQTAAIKHKNYSDRFHCGQNHIDKLWKKTLKFWNERQKINNNNMKQSKKCEVREKTGCLPKWKNKIP